MSAVILLKYPGKKVGEVSIRLVSKVEKFTKQNYKENKQVNRPEIVDVYQCIVDKPRYHKNYQQ